MSDLPIIESCDDCGACCLQTPIPPFEPGEEAVKNVPETFLTAVRERIQQGQQFEVQPCVWFDSVSRRCLHYDFRPDNCRKFEIGSDLCRISRWDAGLDLQSPDGES